MSDFSSWGEFMCGQATSRPAPIIKAMPVKIVRPSRVDSNHFQERREKIVELVRATGGATLTELLAARHEHGINVTRYAFKNTLWRLFKNGRIARFEITGKHCVYVIPGTVYVPPAKKKRATLPELRHGKKIKALGELAMSNGQFETPDIARLCFPDMPTGEKLRNKITSLCRMIVFRRTFSCGRGKRNGRSVNVYKLKAAK